MNNGNGVFVANPAAYSVNTQFVKQGLAVGDFNNDGRPDVLTAWYRRGTAGAGYSTVNLVLINQPTSITAVEVTEIGDANSPGDGYYFSACECGKNQTQTD